MAEEIEPNDSDANSITVGETIVGNLSTNTDRDGFAFEINGPNIITIEFDSPTNSYTDYFNVYIQNSAGDILSAISTGRDASFSAAVKDSGTYFIVVQSDRAAGGYYHNDGEYKVKVSTSSGTGNFEIEPKRLAYSHLYFWYP